LLSRTGPSDSVTSASNERSYERLEELFREKMAADLEFATYIKGLEPGTALRPTVKDHVALLKLRARRRR
jgi:hypothetical protein